MEWVFQIAGAILTIMIALVSSTYRVRKDLKEDSEKRIERMQRNENRFAKIESKLEVHDEKHSNISNSIDRIEDGIERLNKKIDDLIKERR